MTERRNARYGDPIRGPRIDVGVERDDILNDGIC
jgi:hypothetical protein